MLSFQILSGQTTLHVVTKKIEHEYVFNKTDNLIIRAEKGVIDIQPWQSDKVKVVIKIIVKNKDLRIAKKELEYVNWKSYQKNTVLQLSNSVILPGNTNLKSIVRVEYLVRMPHGANLTVKNSFGQLKISDLSFTGKIDIQYCDLILEDIYGTIDVTSNVGDLNFSGISGSLNVSSKYSIFQINNPAGNLNLTSKYGSIKVNMIKPFSTLNISAERCDIAILNKSCMEPELNLEAKYAAINLNESCYIKKKSLLSKKTTGSQPNVINTYKYSPSIKSPSIQIKSIYGNISLD
jgi:hypothetical protein